MTRFDIINPSRLYCGRLQRLQLYML